MELVIEMSDSVSAKYATIHRKGCRDVRDPESLGEVTSYAALPGAVYDATGWTEYDPQVASEDEIAHVNSLCKPCVKLDA